MYAYNYFDLTQQFIDFPVVMCVIALTYNFRAKSNFCFAKWLDCLGFVYLTL